MMILLTRKAVGRERFCTVGRVHEEVPGHFLKGCEEKSRQWDMSQRAWTGENGHRRHC